MLRADPDVIMVGEIRDAETARIAIESALTGHLVLSTLHTNDAPSAITRLTEMGIEPFLTASALDCVVAQRLVRMLCPHCKQADHPHPVGARGRPASASDDDVEAYEPVGCSRCGGSGYKGRAGLYEVMTLYRRDPHPDRSSAPRPTRSPRGASSRACARCARTASSASSRASPRLPRSQESRKPQRAADRGTTWRFDFADSSARGDGDRRLRPAPDRGLAADAAQARPAARRSTTRAEPAGGARDRLLDPHQRPAPEAGDRLADRPRLLDPRQGPLPRERLLPARLDRRRLPPDPAGDAGARHARPAAGAARLHQEAARVRAGHGPDRLGQVHHARRDDRRDQRGAPRAHPHDRGPDRVPAPSQELHRQPARARRRRAELRARR